MKKSVIAAAIFATCALSSLTPAAAQADLKGYPASTCGFLVDLYNNSSDPNNSRDNLGLSTLAYWSGRNSERSGFGRKNLANVDFRSVANNILNYCASNRNTLVYKYMDAIYYNLPAMPAGS